MSLLLPVFCGELLLTVASSYVGNLNNESGSAGASRPDIVIMACSGFRELYLAVFLCQINTFL